MSRAARYRIREKLFREPRLMTLLVACIALLVVLLYVQMPVAAAGLPEVDFLSTMRILLAWAVLVLLVVPLRGAASRAHR